MAHLADPKIELRRSFGGGGEVRALSVPGRVNLIGEHIDYHGLPVLPIAIRQHIRLAWRRRDDRKIRAISTEPYGLREFEWTRDLGPAEAGDWQNYIRAAACAVNAKWPLRVGIDAAVQSDLPPAAGLSSSSALLVAFTLALLRANRLAPTFEELMEVLPEGEHFVGTRGGGMDHAAVLGSHAGCASLIEFDPLAVRPIFIPRDWAFLVAHSMISAEKSGAVREEYNARRRAGVAALERLSFPTYRAAIEGRTLENLASLAHERLTVEAERNAFLHVAGEALRVRAAVSAMEQGDAGEFGRLLQKSHASLRDLLKVSCEPLDELVQAAMECRASGARLTGAGFGGCVVIFCGKRQRARLRRGLIERYYSRRTGFDETRHLLDAEPGPGVLQEKHAASYY
jgi:galactokinase